MEERRIYVPGYLDSTDLLGVYYLNIELERRDMSIIWEKGLNSFKDLKLVTSPSLSGFISFARKFINNPDYKINWVKRNKNKL